MELGLKNKVAFVAASARGLEKALHVNLHKRAPGSLFADAIKRTLNKQNVK